MEKKNVKIGLIGCGTVGTRFVKHFNSKRLLFKKKTGIDFQLAKIADRNTGKEKIHPLIYTGKVEDILSSRDIDIVVELMGGIEPANTYIRKALSCGKSVVTANKALLSEKSSELLGLAEKNRAYLGFEASVASAIPVVKSLRESFIGNNITRFMAILNGTTNYILTQMSLFGGNFSQALEKAQKLGYAESNPALDIEGFDTAHKLSILSSLSFNKSVSWKNIFTEGIKKIDAIDIQFADEFGYRIKLLAIAKKNRDGIELRVHPTFLPSEHLLSRVEDVYNAVYLEGDMMGKSLMYGEGAGGNAAASAVLADVVDIGKKLINGPQLLMNPVYENEKLAVMPMESICTRYYFRFTVPDRPGILAMITDVLGKNGISIASVIQKEENRNNAVPVVILTHRASERAVQKAIKEIDRLSIIESPTMLIRVEE
ncbi:MAG TPA: homoserine dehydrogenase [bacterium]|nr:homoserine dehydrogenase [bacterium]